MVSSAPTPEGRAGVARGLAAFRAALAGIPSMEWANLYLTPVLPTDFGGH